MESTATDKQVVSAQDSVTRLTERKDTSSLTQAIIGGIPGLSNNFSFENTEVASIAKGEDMDTEAGYASGSASSSVNEASDEVKSVNKDVANVSVSFSLQEEMPKVEQSLTANLKVEAQELAERVPPNDHDSNVASLEKEQLQAKVMEGSSFGRKQCRC